MLRLLHFCLHYPPGNDVDACAEDEPNLETQSINDLLDQHEEDFDIGSIFPLDEGEDGGGLIAATVAYTEWSKIMGFED